MGTQFDTFSHQMIGTSMYNCFKLEDIASRNGFTKLGVQQVGALVTRGVLIDVAALKRTPVLAETYEITPQDLQQALAEQKLTLQPGDAVLIHTGWGTLWGKDNARYQRSSPGIGTAAAEWLAKQDPMLVGADNGAVEISPNPDKQLAGPVHQIMLVVNGIHLLENLRLDELAARARSRVRADRRAAEDPGRHRVDGRAHRHQVTCMSRTTILRWVVTACLAVGRVHACGTGTCRGRQPRRRSFKSIRSGRSHSPTTGFSGRCPASRWTSAGTSGSCSVRAR